MNDYPLKSLLEEVQGSLPSTQHNQLLVGGLSVKAEPAAPTLTLKDLQARAFPHGACARHLVRNGTRNRLQCYLCSYCVNTYKVASASSIFCLRSYEHLKAYPESMRQGLCQPVTAARLGLSIKKVCRWRHIFLGSDTSPWKLLCMRATELPGLQSKLNLNPIRSVIQ